HSAVALAAQGRRVAALDLDTRQRTLGRYLDNRKATMNRLAVDLPMPVYDTFDPAGGTAERRHGATKRPYFTDDLHGFGGSDRGGSAAPCGPPRSISRL
ncbi:MAG: division plane positioning ATPase MipZ, partial [Allosphingosinicella sp.]